MDLVNTVILVASLITSLILIGTTIGKIHTWFLKQEEQDTQIANIKKEQRILCKGISACLDGLEQLGCNHSVPVAKQELEEHLNDVAHE